MKCKVGTRYIDVQNIGPPSMNYGQLWRWEGSEKLKYEYSMPLAEFVERVGDWFSTYRKEIIDDAENVDKGDFPLLDEYKEKGYPSLDTMLIKYNDLLKGFVLFADLEFLNIFSGDMINGEEKYSINTLEWLEIGEQISFGGIAYKVN